MFKISQERRLRKFVRMTVGGKVREIVRDGDVRGLVAAELHREIGAVFNEALVAEQAKDLSRRPYGRAAGSPSRNGFREVTVPGFLGRMTLRRPVERSGWRKSRILTALRAAGDLGVALLATRSWFRGMSTRATAEEMRESFGAKMSASTVSTLTNELLPIVRDWEERPVPTGIRYVFLDAFYLPVRREATTRQAVFVALGVTGDGMRHILGIMIGDRESGDMWSAFLKDLLRRGLDRNALALVVSDDHKAIISAVEKELGVPHQLCVVHRLRNVQYRVAAPDRKAFMADFRAIYWAPNRDAALVAAGRLRERWEATYPRPVSMTLDRIESFIRFFDMPQKDWTLLRTTNLIERFIREARRRLDPVGAMQGEDVLMKLVWGVTEAQERRWSRRRYWSSYNMVVHAAA